MNIAQFQEKLLSIQDNMMSFALALTANSDDAQDLLQDTTLKVLNNQKKFVDNVNFKGWVLTVMRNIFINNYHKIVKNQAVVDTEIDLYNLNGAHNFGFDSPESSFHAKEISKAITELNKDLRDPFAMYISGYKYSEIAEMLDLPLGTVKCRIHFARHELQHRLKDFNESQH